MTWALCLNCGETKFGAILKCEHCGVSSSGNRELDMFFSDHNYSAGTLEQLGRVVKSINAVSDMPDERFCAFMLYVSTRHPEMLSYEPEEDMIEKIEEILRKADPPDVIVAKPNDDLEDKIQ
ncbi:MAG: hypothetical protein OEZ28_01620 [Nitrospinota bacterium]|nr:hypothetical protein [Nitrospinota bacterium]